MSEVLAGNSAQYCTRQSNKDQKFSRYSEFRVQKHSSVQCMCISNARSIYGRLADSISVIRSRQRSSSSWPNRSQRNLMNDKAFLNRLDASTSECSNCDRHGDLCARADSCNPRPRVSEVRSVQGRMTSTFY